MKKSSWIIVYIFFLVRTSKWMHLFSIGSSNRIVVISIRQYTEHLNVKVLMAIPLSDVGWFISSHLQDKIVCQGQNSVAFGVENLAILNKARRHNMATMFKSSQSENNMTIVIEENAKRLAETWKEIHGEND